MVIRTMVVVLLWLALTVPVVAEEWLPNTTRIIWWEYQMREQGAWAWLWARDHNGVIWVITDLDVDEARTELYDWFQEHGFGGYISYDPVLVIEEWEMREWVYRRQLEKPKPRVEDLLKVWDAIHPPDGGESDRKRAEELLDGMPLVKLALIEGDLD